MDATAGNYFSGPIMVFHGKRLPEKATLAGYSALIEAFDLKVPLPRTLFATGDHHRIVEKSGWRILTPRHAPHPDLNGHLTFAIKYEGLNLAVLKKLFTAIGAQPVKSLVHENPTGAYSRRIWFLYEWLLGSQLDLPNAVAGRYVSVVDPKIQLTVKNEQNSPRHRVRNNLPGVPELCPMVFRTAKLDKFLAMNLPQRARELVDKVPRDVMARSAAFLLLKDSKASYAIEGERSPQNRIQRWGRVIGEAGQCPLDLVELFRLQKMVIGDSRFIRLGLRTEGGFVGEHNRDTGIPHPAHISAKPEDLEALVQGLISFERDAVSRLDPVVAAAVLAFAFNYIHPFEDGNGRIHRYLIHHVLAVREFNPPGVVFPISSAILEHIEMYRQVLESYANQLLEVVEWEPTELGNVHVLNDTADFYRYFDATPHVEFLYECVRQTIEKDLPDETRFLSDYDTFRTKIEAMVDMPQPSVNLLFRFLRQNQGQLSKRARQREFECLTGDEINRIEIIYTGLFG